MHFLLFFFPPSSPLVILQPLGCVGYRAFEGDMEEEGTPCTETLEQCCGGFKPWFSFLPADLCPDSVRVSYSARHDTNSGQKKKVNYLVHSCSVSIFIVLQGSSPSSLPRLFWLWLTSTHPSPRTPHTDTYMYMYFFICWVQQQTPGFWVPDI